MPHNIRLFSDVGAKMSMFDNKAKMHKENQMINPFSDWDGSGTRRKLSRDDPDYGKPLEGSKTAERGKKAQLEMISDMVELCDVIFDCGVRSPDGRGAICFGDVFRLYSQINDKCVGLLMRGRKHNILDFEGEMLFQRRDDDKMIELLLPLNTIRYKYGMPERPGCGEVRPDLLEELEQQLRDKQPARCRSMEQLGLPPPPLHKSRSCELPRNAAGGGDASWRLTPEPAGRRSSEDALEQIGEDEGAVGGVVFTAMPEAAASDTGQKEEADGEADGAQETGPEDDATVPVKFAVGDDDEDSVSKTEDTAEKEQDDTQVTAPPVWPEVTIVVGDDDAENKATEKHEEAKIFNGDQTQSESEHMENENIQIKISDLSEKASTSDIASLAPDSESDFDFWGSTEQDSCGGGDESTDKSAMQTPRSESPARRLSSELVEAVPDDQGSVAKDETASTEGGAEETGVNDAHQHSGELSPEDQQEEEKASSSENVSNEIKDAPEDGTQPTDKEEPEVDNADKNDGGFSFWDVEGEKETSEKVPNAVESERRNSENRHVNSESANPDDPEQVENGEVDKSESNTPDATETAADAAATTNGETFSFWDDTEEEDPAPTRRKSETCVLKDESRVRTPTVSESGLVPSAANGEWEATSAERPAGGDGGPATALSPPALSVPHLTLSDESEPMPAR